MKVTTKQLENALEKSHGNISLAAHLLSESLGQTISRQTLHERVKKSGKLTEICRQSKERIVDLAESKLYDKIQDGDIRAILFALETAGKDRGWTKKTEHAITKGCTVADVLSKLEERIKEEDERGKAEIKQKVRDITGDDMPQIEVHFIGTDGNGKPQVV